MPIKEENLIFCESCKKETEHSHLIDSPYGIEGAYMSGSERYECVQCGTPIFYSDKVKKDVYKHLVFKFEPAQVAEENQTSL